MTRRIIPEHEAITCDRCLADIEPSPRVDTVYRGNVPVQYDLCPVCAEALERFIGELVVES